MDWANERYVRLYTRETTTTRLLRWEAQAVLPQILKHVDRAGVLDLGGVSPAEAVAAALPKWPLEVIEAAIGSLGDKDSLVGRGVIEIGDDAIVLPNFLDAQEAAQSEAQRQRDSREKRRAKKRRSVTTGHECGQAVTNRDQESRAVTRGHVASPQPSCAEPTKPNQPAPSPDARAHDDDPPVLRVQPPAVSTDPPRGPDPSPAERNRADLHQRAESLRTRTSPSADFELLREWRQWGNDPEGLGQWPRPKAPRGGPQLPQLQLHTRILDQLEGGRSAIEIHRLVHLWSRMVEDGALATDDYKAVYLFSGSFESFELRALAWEARETSSAPERERKAAEEAARERGLTDAAIDNVLEGTPWKTA